MHGLDLSVGDWQRISKAFRILLLKLFSFLAMTAALPSSNLSPVFIGYSPTAESVNLVVLKFFLLTEVEGSGGFSNIDLLQSAHSSEDQEAFEILCQSPKLNQDRGFFSKMCCNA